MFFSAMLTMAGGVVGLFFGCMLIYAGSTLIAYLLSGDDDD